MFSPGHFAAGHYKANHFPGGGGGGVIIAVVKHVRGFTRNVGRLLGKR